LSCMHLTPSHICAPLPHSFILFVFFFVVPLPPRSPLFPYTTLFRSLGLFSFLRRCHRRRSPLRLRRRWRACEKVEPARSLWRQRSEEHTSELQSPDHLVCRLLLEKKKRIYVQRRSTERVEHGINGRR